MASTFRFGSLAGDAAWLIENDVETVDDNAALLDLGEKFQSQFDTPSIAGCELLSKAMTTRWKGIMENPDATLGKKKKPKFKQRPVAIAKWLQERISDQD